MGDGGFMHLFDSFALFLYSLSSYFDCNDFSWNFLFLNITSLRIIMWVCFEMPSVLHQ